MWLSATPSGTADDTNIPGSVPGDIFLENFKKVCYDKKKLTGGCSMRKNRLIVFLLALLLAVVFAGCGAAEETPETTEIKAEENIREAECPICQKTVSWMGLTQAYVDTIQVKDEQGELIDSAIMSGDVYETRHYYLAEDLTYNDSPVMGFFRGPGKGLTTCLDLNNHNITTPATTSIFGNSGVLNVFGDGVVTGYSPNNTEGAAVRCGNRNANNGLNLYGGTYKKTAQTAKTSPVVGFDGAGRCVSVYDGVVIDAGDGVAVFANSAASREKDGYLLLQGCTVKGDVVFAELDVYATKADIIDADISGKVTVPAGHNLTLKGKVIIGELALGEGILVNLPSLTAGSKIGLSAVGVFTTVTDHASVYAGYFLPMDSGKKIKVVNSSLCCE